MWFLKREWFLEHLSGGAYLGRGLGRDENRASPVKSAFVESSSRHGQDDEFVSQRPGILSRAKAFRKALETREWGTPPQGQLPVCCPAELGSPGLFRWRDAAGGENGWAPGLPLHAAARGERFCSPGSKLPVCVQTSELMSVSKRFLQSGFHFGFCASLSKMSVFHPGANV